RPPSPYREYATGETATVPRQPQGSQAPAGTERVTRGFGPPVEPALDEPGQHGFRGAPPRGAPISSPPTEPLAQPRTEPLAPPPTEPMSRQAPFQEPPTAEAPTVRAVPSPPRSMAPNQRAIHVEPDTGPIATAPADPPWQSRRAAEEDASFISPIRVLGTVGVIVVIIAMAGAVIWGLNLYGDKF
ncbi:MAG: hypothetical protein ACRD0P_11570, partial [Stackebrandtia sp.]